MKFGIKLGVFGVIYFFVWTIWATSHEWIGTSYLAGLVTGWVVVGLLVLASRQEGEKQKAREDARDKSAQEMAANLGISKAEAQAIINLGNSCPKCKGFDFYLQPFTDIVQVGLSNFKYQRQVRYCSNCDVEFVPRIILK